MLRHEQVELAIYRFLVAHSPGEWVPSGMGDLSNYTGVGNRALLENSLKRLTKEELISLKRYPHGQTQPIFWTPDLDANWYFHTGTFHILVTEDGPPYF